jgi:ribosomal protein S12 methylthiotransferase accessory factor YcaO
VAVAVWEITSDVEMPAYLCTVADRADDRLQPPLFASGMGCHPSRQIALLRALTEAAQSRLRRSPARATTCTATTTFAGGAPTSRFATGPTWTVPGLSEASDRRRPSTAPPSTPTYPGNWRVCRRSGSGASSRSI